MPPQRWILLLTRRVALVVLLTLAQDVIRASPPEYLAATREPAERASEEANYTFAF
jgi:hypothetical protein